MYQKQATILSKHFGLSQDDVSIKPIGNGHINTTLLLKSPEKNIVVQKLNTHVFPDPIALVNNARQIEIHLSDKKDQQAYQLEIIKHVPTTKEDYVVEIEGESWRALEFIGRSYSEDVVANQEQAEIAANAFGQFAAALEDFDASNLHSVIPDFHNLTMRLDALKRVVNADPVGRLASCQPEVDFCLAQSQLLSELAELVDILPIRACHNDTKINNMLFCNQTQQAKAVIDLDTCMPGYWMFDFGDMVRTFCSPEAEDSTNLERVKVREEIFQAIVDGYVAPLDGIITKQEKQSFWLGAKVMTFMIGVRFLTDFIDGDNYFSTKYDSHNLDRARNQFALYRDLVEKTETLQAILFK